MECDSKIRKQISFSFSLTLPDKCLFSLSSNPHKPLRKLFLLVNTWYAVSHIFLLESEAKVQIAKSSNLFSLLLNEIEKYIIKCLTTYLLDVQWGQSIKFVHIVTSSELYESWWNNLVFLEIITSDFCRVSEASKIDCFKN